jgi:CDP-diacylglycerol--glycerol-3-phosphate 3-phosphatidyltransferase
VTLPTQLTLARIVLAPIVVLLLLAPGWAAKLAAFVGFLLAGLTDWLDGYLARRWRQTSPLGALLDPIADKILVLGAFLVFVHLRLVPPWVALVIALREVSVTWARLFLAGRKVILSTTPEGKQKLVSQLIAIGVAMVVLITRESAGRWSSLEPLGRLAEALLPLSLWIAVALTLVSGGSFFWRQKTVLADALGRVDG